jgi:hypothetical protein
MLFCLSNMLQALALPPSQHDDDDFSGHVDYSDWLNTRASLNCTRCEYLQW